MSPRFKNHYQNQDYSEFHHLYLSRAGAHKSIDQGLGIGSFSWYRIPDTSSHFSAAIPIPDTSSLRYRIPDTRNRYLELWYRIPDTRYLSSQTLREMINIMLTAILQRQWLHCHFVSSGIWFRFEFQRHICHKTCLRNSHSCLTM